MPGCDFACSAPPSLSYFSPPVGRVTVPGRRSQRMLRLSGSRFRRKPTPAHRQRTHSRPRNHRRRLHRRRPHRRDPPARPPARHDTDDQPRPGDDCLTAPVVALGARRTRRHRRRRRPPAAAARDRPGDSGRRHCSTTSNNSPAISRRSRQAACTPWPWPTRTGWRQCEPRSRPDRVGTRRRHPDGAGRAHDTDRRAFTVPSTPSQCRPTRRSRPTTPR